MPSSRFPSCIVAVLVCKLACLPSASVTPTQPAPEPATSSGADPDASAQQDAKTGEAVDTPVAVAPDEPQPPLETAGPKVEGAVDIDDIERVVRAKAEDIRTCHNLGLLLNPKLGDGRVVITFVIDGNGKVSSAVVAEDTFSVTDVGRCLADSVSEWRFPKPTDRGEVHVTYPFDMKED